MTYKLNARSPNAPGSRQMHRGVAECTGESPKAPAAKTNANRNQISIDFYWNFYLPRGSQRPRASQSRCSYFTGGVSAGAELSNPASWSLVGWFWRSDWSRSALDRVWCVGLMSETPRQVWSTDPKWLSGSFSLDYTCLVGIMCMTAI